LYLFEEKFTRIDINLTVLSEIFILLNVVLKFLRRYKVEIVAAGFPVFFVQGLVGTEKPVSKVETGIRASVRFKVGVRLGSWSVS